MVPLIALMAGTLVARLAGFVGLAGYIGSWSAAIAVGLATMFLVTASAHAFQPRRAGLIAIVPAAVPRPAAMVTVTGVLEVAGAIGLLTPPEWIPWARPAAAVCLGLLLVVMFPANVYASRGRRHPDAPSTPLPRRTALQLAYLAAVVVVALGV